MPLISIIIPCYNVEKYIDRCLESVVNQTIGIDNLEIIVVNDASTDNTLECLKSWESRYPKHIMVITYDENIRQGGARNIGLQYATADYIGFVDSDDWIEHDMFEVLYEPLKSHHYDMVRGKCIADKYQGEKQIDNSERDDQCYEFHKIGDFYIHEVDENRIGNVGRFGGVWSAIYSKRCIMDNEIYFPEKLAYEDNYWFCILRLYINNMYIVDKIVYHYFVNIESTARSRNASHHFDRLKIELGIIEEYKKRDAFQYFEKELERDYIQRFYLNMLHIIFTKFDYIPDVYPFLKKVVLQYFPHYRDNPYYDKWDPVDQSLLDLLEMDTEEFTIEYWEKIKEAYLKAFGYKK